jgi:hypothetical protein
MRGRFEDWEAVVEGEQRVLAERLAGWQDKYPQPHPRPPRPLAVVRSAA